MKEKKVRNSNIELMRILCILFVIGGHYYTHGIEYEGAPFWNEVFLKIFGGFSKFGVNCFVLVTGYFGEKLTTRRIVPLIKDRWFYSVFMSVVLLTTGVSQISMKFGLKTMFPLLLCRHNYITVFVVLYFFIPYLNILLNTLTKKQFGMLILTEFIFFSVIPTVVGQFSVDMYSYILWMVYLYQIGYYLKKYNPAIPWKIAMPVSVALLLACSLIIEPLLHIETKLRFANTQNSCILLVASVAWLGFFANLKMPHISLINWLAKSTFAVYILHDDPDVRAVIWSKIFHCKDYLDSSFLPVHFFISVLAIYFCCIAVDKIYAITLSKPLLKLTDYLMQYLFVLKDKTVHFITCSSKQ